MKLEKLGPVGPNNFGLREPCSRFFRTYSNRSEHLSCANKKFKQQTN
jgi:hypothetical protein